ncbi:MurR/RpiR family transcriptional regulator [Paracoccus siganidrum]|uniref:MurR/RpiR family transcriptional regulator n=1 Tax=Paracoccus siganidrum TaxID=1276757 RepID=A0A419A4R8_9RHOB|nr:MurR/RpiR family transcriptional regulator [Paracoccus siganidrum]RJL09640.1 MurR/RpiR family transcriptional regulator [Paracoccus siganidrum]RMC35846.1 MurR/RpiR family transcriptional regulator [Paracoccus siganidrum]
MTAAPEPRPIAASPPATLSELRDLAVAISRGEAQVTLGAKTHSALGRILDLTGNPALLSITTLAEVLGVHPSTLTRLATALGYSGFPALQKVLLSASMAAPGEFYSRQARAALETGSSSRAQAARLCRENQANIDRFLDGFEERSFEAAVEMIMSAPRVAVYGIRQFHAVASFLVYGLRMIRSDVSLIDSNSLGVAESLSMMGDGDVLVSASCAPYSRQVVDVAAAARRNGLSTVAITDRASSPLVDSSCAAILCPHDSSFLSNSIGAFMVATECLINACAAARPEAARRALRERDRMIAEMGVERDG